MELEAARKLAKSLLTQHGFGRLTFEFDRGKRRIAACHSMNLESLSGKRYWIPVKVTLSKHYAVHMTEEEVRMAILHEIAHAKTPGEGHGPKWKAEARKLGVPAEACTQLSNSPEPAVQGACPVCNQVISKMHRMPLRVYWHNGCGDKNRPLRWFKHGNMVPLNEMPARYRAESLRIRSMNNGKSR